MKTDPIRQAYERAFTGGNRTAATWAAYRAGWKAAQGEPVATLERNPARGILRVEFTDDVTELPAGVYPLYAGCPMRRTA